MAFAQGVVEHGFSRVRRQMTDQRSTISNSSLDDLGMIALLHPEGLYQTHLIDEAVTFYQKVKS